MATTADRTWWQRVRGKNRTLKGLISARRRYSARMDRLAGKPPSRRRYSVPEIARRVGTPLAILKRVIRGQDEPPPALLLSLAKDLELPVRELKRVAGHERARSSSRSGAPRMSSSGPGDADPFQLLEEGLISSARAFVELLRSYTEREKGDAPPRGRR